MQRKHPLLAGLAAAIICAMPAISSAAQLQSAYPARPIRVLIPFPAAGASDTIGRSLGEQLAAQRPTHADGTSGRGMRRGDAGGYTDAIAASD